jgi:3-hydroxyisobutyrate dehydrogenase
VVITCVGNDDDLADVVLGPQGLLRSMRPGALFIDHTTASARIARQIAVEARDREVHCVDAPMTGAQPGAEAGTLTLMCGGKPAAVEEARAVMSAYARRIVHVGKPGTGQVTKMINQICMTGVLAGLSEALRLAQAEHLDLDRVLEAISGGAAQSWQMDNHWTSMARDEFDFGLTVDLMRKDLGLALDEGRGLGLAADHRADRPVLRRSSGDGRRPSGHHRAGAPPAPPGRAEGIICVSGSDAALLATVLPVQPMPMR